jgi:hypothetical protein
MLKDEYYSVMAGQSKPSEGFSLSRLLLLFMALVFISGRLVAVDLCCLSEMGTLKTQVQLEMLLLCRLLLLADHRSLLSYGTSKDRSICQPLDPPIIILARTPLLRAGTLCLANGLSGVGHRNSEHHQTLISSLQARIASCTLVDVKQIDALWTRPFSDI